MAPSALRAGLAALALASAVVCSTAAPGAEPLFTLSADGTSFEYRARPGDTLGRVAELFGIRDAAGVEALRRSNGIVDADRIPAGFVFRVPNWAAVRTAEQAVTAALDEARRRELARGAERDKLRARVDRLTADLDGLQRRARLEPFKDAALALLAVIAAIALWVSWAAAARAQRMDRQGRRLAAELDQKRKVALAERQEAAKRILDLEAYVRELEAGRSQRRAAHLVLTEGGGSPPAKRPERG